MKNVKRISKKKTQRASTRRGEDKVIVRAIRSEQGDGVDVYSFFLYGSDLGRIADISRIVRSDAKLHGFQRKEIKNHVKSIAEFLDSGSVLFPNAIILALSEEVKFKFSRGSRPAGMVDVGDAGILSIPVRQEGRRAAWIVDGQQRSLALARAKNSKIAVPVVGFVSSNIETHREQFILVNKARPLPVRLINELLPEVSVLLPRDLAARKLPSELCNLLSRDQQSPFHRLIRRESDPAGAEGIVVDTALVNAIKQNLKAPMGALSQYRKVGADGGSDIQGMYRSLIMYWSAVRAAFPDAWGRPPTESRLMHSAGIRAMAALMDQVMLRADSSADPPHEVQTSLARVAPYCCWTEGVWEGLEWRWNEIQSTTHHISRLSDHLIRLDRELSRPGR